MAHSQPASSVHNPLATDPAHERRVRERAYHLWESGGKLHGHDVEYWERARELIGMEDSAGSGLLPNPETTHLRAVGIEEADIQENLGEFPGVQTDQGEVQTTPAPKRRTRAKPKKSA
jgi:hypothetical protein